MFWEHPIQLPVRPFHWEIEFPEVFGGGREGFDAIVGNPPFAGKKASSPAIAEAIRIGSRRSTRKATATQISSPISSVGRSPSYAPTAHSA
jgi:Eco57I restriction-modification methylase